MCRKLELMPVLQLLSADASTMHDCTGVLLNKGLCMRRFASQFFPILTAPFLQQGSRVSAFAYTRKTLYLWLQIIDTLSSVSFTIAFSADISRTCKRELRAYLVGLLRLGLGG